MTTIAEALREAIESLPDGMDRTDAEYLLAHVLEKPRVWLYAHADDELAPPHWEVFRGLQARRKAGEPVAYLTGQRGFWSLDLQVTPRYPDSSSRNRTAGRTGFGFPASRPACCCA